MSLQIESTEAMLHQDIPEAFALTVVLRQFDDESERYFVAECLELPGCISQGDTEEEARENIEMAVKECLSVILEDGMKRAMAHRQMPDLTGIKSQRRLNIGIMPQLKYA